MAQIISYCPKYYFVALIALFMLIQCNTQVCSAEPQILDIPYVHQVYDTFNAKEAAPFWGNEACVPTCAVMILAYYDIITEKEMEVTLPDPHISDYGQYVYKSEPYGNDLFTMTASSTVTKDSCHDLPKDVEVYWTGQGAWGYIWGDGHSPPNSLEEFLELNGVEAEFLPGLTKEEVREIVISNIEQERPLIARIFIGNTNDGHYVVIGGYEIVNGEIYYKVFDPFGDINLYTDSGGNVNTCKGTYIDRSPQPVTYTYEQMRLGEGTGYEARGIIITDYIDSSLNEEFSIQKEWGVETEGILFYQPKMADDKLVMAYQSDYSICDINIGVVDSEGKIISNKLSEFSLTTQYQFSDDSNYYITSISELPEKIKYSSTKGYEKETQYLPYIYKVLKTNSQSFERIDLFNAFKEEYDNYRFFTFFSETCWILPKNDGNYLLAFVSRVEANGNTQNPMECNLVVKTINSHWNAVNSHILLTGEGLNAFYINDVFSTEDSGFLIFGEISRQLNNQDNSQDDIFIIKLDKNGEEEWTLITGGDDNDYPSSICELKDYYLIMSITESINDLSGKPLENRQDITNIITKTIKASEYSGSVNDYTFEYLQHDILITAVDKSGNVLWQKCFGGSENEESLTCFTTGDNVYLVAGTGSSDGDVPENNLNNGCWVVQLDENGKSIQDSWIISDYIRDEYTSLEDCLYSGDGDIYLIGMDYTSQPDKIWINKYSLGEINSGNDTGSFDFLGDLFKWISQLFN